MFRGYLPVHKNNTVAAAKGNKGKNIRLVFVSTLVYNYFFPGRVKQAGGQTRIYNLARSFARLKGYEVFCLVGDFGQPERVVRENVTLVKSRIDQPLAVFQVARVLKLLDPDIILDFCASPRLFLYAVLKRVLQTKIVFFTGSDNDVNGGYKKVENPVFDLFYRIGLRHADDIIAQVPLHQTLLRKKFGLKSRLVLSPYLEMPPLERVDKDIILWVGRAAYYKKPELFVQLARAHPGEKFVMICNTSPYDNGFMDSIKKRLDDIPNLEFYEYVPFPAMESYYSRAKLLVNTSDFEGFPNTFIEAAVKATPVLSLNSDPNAMLSIHGGGRCCNGDVQCMGRQLKQMLAKESMLAEMGRCIFNYANRFHRLESAVRKLDMCFRKVLWES